MTKRERLGDTSWTYEIDPNYYRGIDNGLLTVYPPEVRSQADVSREMLIRGGNDYLRAILERSVRLAVDRLLEDTEVKAEVDRRIKRAAEEARTEVMQTYYRNGH